MRYQHRKTAVLVLGAAMRTAGHRYFADRDTVGSERAETRFTAIEMIHSFMVDHGASLDATMGTIPLPDHETDDEAPDRGPEP